MIPKKHFGQNFLKDKIVLEKIIKAIPNIRTSEFIIEIGAGLGDLSDEILKCYPLIAYEIDRDLCRVLELKFSSYLESGRLRLIQEDVLNVKLFDKPYVIVANLPYYVATHIILKALKDALCKGMIVMVQKEVALKFIRDDNPLGIIAAWHGGFEILTHVPPSSFFPAPKVDSSIIMIKKNAHKLPEGFEKLLKIAFSAPRKFALKNLSTAFDKAHLKSIWNMLNLDSKIRPSEIGLSLYHQIFNHLKDTECKNTIKMKD